MDLNKIHSKKNILISTNQGEIFNTIHNIDGINFRVNDLEKLYKIDDEEIWKMVIQEVKGLKKTLINYLSEENLTLYGKQFGDKLIVISAGEINRGLYKVILEGVWKQTPFI